MRGRIILAILVAAAGVLLAASCRRSDVVKVVIEVPDMAGARDVRIATNAALDEVVAQYDGIRNDIEVDLSRRIVLYHESQRLLMPEYQARIEARIAEVGFSADVVEAAFDPPAPVPTVDGPFQMWGGRHTAVIHVPDMDSITDANIVTDAVAYARLGRDDPRVAVDPSRRRITAAYQSLAVSLKSIEHAVACAGYAANDTPANLGRPDAVPHGWSLLEL